MVMGGGKGCWFCPQEPAPAPATVRHAPRAVNNPVPRPSKHPGARKMRLNRADPHTGHSQCCARCFPAVLLYLSWLHIVPPPGRAGAMERKAVPVPLPQLPTTSPPPPSTNSSSRPILCDLRQVDPPNVWCEQEVTCRPHSWFFPCFARLQ